MMSVRSVFRAAVSLFVVAAGTAAFAQWTESGTNIYSTNPGNVGIGVTNPTHKLTVFAPSSRFGDGGSFNFDFNMPAAHTYAVRFRTANTDRMTITGAGNVGIGNAFPTYRLEVIGSTRLQTALLSADTFSLPILHVNQEQPAGYYLLQGTTSTLDGNQNPVYTNRFYVDRTGGAYFGGIVGVGTTSPAGRFHVHGASDLTTFPATPITATISDSSAYTTANAGSGIGFSAIYNSSGATTTLGVISAVKESQIDGNYDGALTFGTRKNGVANGTIERMRIKSTGEVVIAPGAAAPYTTKLTVHGDADIKGNIAAKYQDLAEWVPSTEDLQPGTVVVLNPAGRNQVMASTAAYDTRVAGVVSAQPGIILGEEGAGMEKIATTGRVKLRVDATSAPIRVGDLLVTSGIPGVAMRSNPVEIQGHSFHRPGTIIGKALEPLESGRGEILVLLSMQ